MAGRYKILEELGSGGAGSVVKAYDTQLDRYVALKRLLTKEQEEEPDAQAATLRKEASALAALQHPNIVTIFDLGSDEHGFFIVMELLEGETLADFVKASPLNLTDFAELATQTLEGILSAHAQSILHRDLKPENMKVKRLPGGRLQVKLVDFGLARLSYGAKKQTEDHGGNVLGSIYYMAPEQFLRRPLDGRTDLYSLGCVYYQALSGRRPFEAPSVAGVMDLHLKHGVALLHDVCPHLPEKLCDWVTWLMSREAADRPANAQEALDAFRGLVAEGWLANHSAALGPQTATNLPARPTSSHPARRPTGTAPTRHGTANVPATSGAFQRQPALPSPRRPSAPSAAVPLDDATARRRSATAAPGAKKSMRWVYVGAALLAAGIAGFFLMKKTGTLLHTLELPSQPTELLAAGHIIHWRAGEKMDAWTDPAKPAGRNDLVSAWHSITQAAGDAALVSYDRKKESCPKYLLEKPDGIKVPLGLLRFESGQGMSHLIDQTKTGGKQYPFGPDTREKGLTLMIIVKPDTRENKQVRILRLRNQDGKASLDVFAADNNEVRAVARVADKTNEIKIGGRNTKLWNILTVVWYGKDNTLLLGVSTADGTKGRKGGGAPRNCPVLNEIRVSEFPKDGKPVPPTDRFSGDLAEIILWPAAMDGQPLNEQEKRLCEFYFATPGKAYN